MKKSILVLSAFVLTLTSCLTKQDIEDKLEETIQFSFDQNSYLYTGTEVGNVNEAGTTWPTRVQSLGVPTHFELYLSDTVTGTYSFANDVAILFDSLYIPAGNTPLHAYVIKYGEVGEYIEGTFEGEVKKAVGTDTTIHMVTGGWFRVIRDN